ncbi:ABC transporter ATP-binding protein [Anaerolineales bacterium]
MSLLEVHEIHTYYGKIHALKGISLSVEEGEVVTLIGGNGAGKTTTLNTICGLLQCSSGFVSFNGADISNTAAHLITRMGIIQSPEGRKVFTRLTVHENLEMGAFVRNDKGGIAQDIDMVYERFPRLLERKSQLAGTMSGGEQQMLAIGRALMSRPRILLLDEPSMGLAPMLVQQIFDVIVELNQQGTTILLVEQNAHMALEVAHRAYVLQSGTVTHQGSAKELQRDSAIIEAYLGG